MDGLISIIMPVYNNEKYISESIKSICQQTYENWELIIVDSASEDKSWEMAERFNDSRITVIRLEENMGLTEAFKAGVKKSRGEFIIRHDPDDISAPNRLEVQADYMHSHSDAGMVGCLVKCFTDDPVFRKACIFIEKLQNSYITADKIEEAIVGGFVPIIFPTLMIRKNLISKAIDVEKDTDFDDHGELLLQLIKYSRVEKVNKVLYHYRRHQGSYHVANEAEHEKYNKRLMSNSDIKNYITYREIYNDLKDKKSKQKINKNSQVRVLMLVDALNIGGTETHVLNLARRLLEMGAYVVVGTSGGPMNELFRQRGIKVIKLPLDQDYISNKNILGVLKQVRDIVDEERINILHCHLFAGMYLGSEMYRIYKMPYVTTIHGLFYPNDVLYSSCFQASEIIAVSEPVKRLLELKMGRRVEGRIKVVPNGIDTNSFKPGSNANHIRQELEIPEDAPIAVYCSRIDWGKTAAAEAFIFSCYKLREQYKNLHAIVVGGGADKNMVARQAQLINRTLKDNTVHVVGPKFDLLPYYQAADIVVGTARVALEAMSCGKPVIAVGNQGYTGLITPENSDIQREMYFGDHDAVEKPDVVKLADDISRLLDNPRMRGNLGDWGRNWCISEFDSRLVAVQTLKIYTDILNGERGE